MPEILSLAPSAIASNLCEFMRRCAKKKRPFDRSRVSASSKFLIDCLLCDSSKKVGVTATKILAELQKMSQISRSRLRRSRMSCFSYGESAQKNTRSWVGKSPGISISYVLRDLWENVTRKKEHVCPRITLSVLSFQLAPYSRGQVPNSDENGTTIHD